ncbi:MAG: hypothetical protein GEU79_17010 [Acidimicrobiia bacterium]|nr:hypothetical protein [Acidimicrobiia bacterium]
MDTGFALSDTARNLAGILILAVVTVETGGLYMLRIVTGRQEATPFRTSFARAGHAHAGVLLILGLVCVVLSDLTGQTGFVAWLSRAGVAVSAILMPMGFFFSSMGGRRENPNRLIVLVYLGATVLAAGLISLGIGLLTVR